MSSLDSALCWSHPPRPLLDRLASGRPSHLKGRPPAFWLSRRPLSIRSAWEARQDVSTRTSCRQSTTRLLSSLAYSARRPASFRQVLLTTLSPKQTSGARGARTLDLRHAMAALSQLSYSPEVGNRTASILDSPRRREASGGFLKPRSPRRDELRHVEIVARVLVAATATEEGVVLAARGARAGLVEAGGQTAVSQAHVAEQALGVVVQ
jgi:hypothetical protein